MNDLKTSMTDATEMTVPRGFPLRPLPFSKTEYYDTNGNKLSWFRSLFVKSDGKGGYLDNKGNKVYKWNTTGSNANPNDTIPANGVRVGMSIGDQFMDMPQQPLGFNEGLAGFMNEFVDELRKMGLDYRNFIPPYFDNKEIACASAVDLIDTVIENVMITRNLTYQQHCDLIMKLGPVSDKLKNRN
jgi:hypothetical protein